MENVTLDDDYYSAYLTVENGVGAPCEWGQANQCPPRQMCEQASFLYDCDGECTEPHQVDRCRCWLFFGHEGETCEDVSANSYITATFFGIGAIIGLVSLYMHLKTSIPVAGLLVQKKLKMNIATTTLFLSTAGVLISTMLTCAYVTSSLLIDSELAFEQYWIGPMFGLMAMFVVPSCLLVCTMWIDVASAGLTRTKAQRQAMQKKVRCGMITASVILSAMFALLAILDMRQEVSYLCVLVFVVTGSLYTYGGVKLSNMLASEGKSKPEGLCGTCKTGTTPGMIVVNTAVNISMCCFSNILGGVIYAVTPNPVASLGVAILITNISVALLTIVLYLRYGLRKALKLEFDLETGSDQTATTDTKTTSGNDAKVAPA